jgi:hypothetical protein
MGDLFTGVVIEVTPAPRLIPIKDCVPHLQ